MAQRGMDEQQATFLARIGRQATDWYLRPLLLPGGLVLLKENLDAAQRRRFMLLLGSRLGSPGQPSPEDEAWPGGQTTAAGANGNGVEQQQSEDQDTGSDADFCQVTVDERRQLFGPL